MPLTKKGKKIYKSMTEEYGDKKGRAIFYASKNKGTIKGVEKDMKAKKGKMIKAVAGILTGPITYKMAKKKKMKMEDLAPIFGAAGLAYSKLRKRKSGSSKKGEMMKKLRGGGAAVRGTNFKGVF